MDLRRARKDGLVTWNKFSKSSRKPSTLFGICRQRFKESSRTSTWVAFHMFPSIAAMMVFAMVSSLFMRQNLLHNNLARGRETKAISGPS